MEIGYIRKVNIDDEMQQSYLDYAMSVIVSRALPDARDGLKPVQRRILYAMHDMNIGPGTDFKKSARIVGEVLGKYHPHGDMAVYEAMARLAQDFTMRYALVDGQGNFGSVDGDPPAAMRYTEARLTNYAAEELSQLDRDTVDFVRNFDDSLDEPVVLPSAIPNLLVNGGSGIAVGMTTSIPPHNLGEVVDALVYMIGNWDKQDDISVQDLMQFIKGPDFPTGGLIFESDDQTALLSSYATGRGRITVRGRVYQEEMGRGRFKLIITELPYQVNKSSLISKIADIVRDGSLEGIADLRDESDRQGMRIVIELKSGADVEQIIRDLYRRTSLQDTFSIILLALVNGEPRLLSLKQALRVFAEHRFEVVRRRSEFDLKKAKERAHILEGLRLAISNLDEIIQIIRSSPDVESARTRLKKRFKLSDVQTQAILDMPLRRLAALERKKIEEEYKDLIKTIKELEILLKSPRKIRHVVEEELLETKGKFGDQRKSKIISLKEAGNAPLTVRDAIPQQNVWVGFTSDNKISRTAGEKPPRLSGTEAPQFVISTNTHDTIYVCAQDGKTFAHAVESLPIADAFAEGAPYTQIAPMPGQSKISALAALPTGGEFDREYYILSVTAAGMVKKSSIKELPGPSSQAFLLSRVNNGDQIVRLLISGGTSDILLVTKMGMAIRFSEEEVRSMGLVAAGVGGIKLQAGDHVIGGAILGEKQELFFLSARGMGWRINESELSQQGRNGQGVIACRLSEDDYLAGILIGKNTTQGLVNFKKSATKSIRLDVIPQTKRNRAGKQVFETRLDNPVISITPIEDSMLKLSEPVIKKKRTARSKATRPAPKKNQRRG